MVESKGEQGITFDDLINEKNVRQDELFSNLAYVRKLKIT